jgi:hypothetical protein
LARGDSGSGTNNIGVYLKDASIVESIGTSIAEAANITIEGVSTDSYGIRLSNGDIVSHGPGTIHVTAEGGGALLDFDTLFDNTIGGATATGAITINADSVNLGGTTNVQSAGALTIQPRTASTTIGIGSGTGELNLDDTEIGMLADGFSSITIGDTSAGTGTVDIDSATFTDPVIIAGGLINDNLGTDINAGTNSVTLIGTVAPGQSPGILGVNGNFAFANNDSFNVEIGGTSPGNTATDHDQINVTGTVTIGTGVALNTSSFGGFTPLKDQQFVIINNDGSDVVSGTFAGLPEGAIIFNFLGSGLSARISYLVRPQV